MGTNDGAEERRENAMGGARFEDERGGRWGIRALVRGGMGCAIVLAWAGCALPEAQPDLTRYYVLTSGRAAVAEAAAASAGEERKVFLKAVNVPEFLRGKIVQVRLAENEVKYIDTARWAEPLEAGLGRVLRESLDRAEGGIEVVTRPMDARDFDIVVQVRRCEGVVPDRMARLEARVEIFSAGLESRRMAEEEFAIEVPGWDGSDYGELAAKLSEAAQSLGAKIGGMIAEVDQSGE